MEKNDSNYYEKEINVIKKELEKMPAGYLIKRGQQFYVNDGGVQKGISKDRRKVRQLARKAYLQRRLKNLEWNCSLEKKKSAQRKTEEPEGIIMELSSFYQTLPGNYFYHSSVYDLLENDNDSRDSRDCNYNSNGNKGNKGRNGNNGNNGTNDTRGRYFTKTNAGYLDGLAYVTNSGIRVRSKSERTIADALNQNKIPYQYEASLALGGERKFPDFTIRRPYDGKMFIWEHLGLMDHDGYKQKMIEKLTLYARFGFFPFYNLILTYEHDLQDPARIQTIIKMFLL